MAGPDETKKNPNPQPQNPTITNKIMVMSKLDFFQIGTEVTIFYSTKFSTILDRMGEGRKIFNYFSGSKEGRKSMWTPKWHLSKNLMKNLLSFEKRN